MSIICRANQSEVFAQFGRDIPSEQAQIGAGSTNQSAAIVSSESPELTLLFFGTKMMYDQPSSDRSRCD